MYPQSQTLHLNAEAVSGILGSVSIACWVVVFSPQIIENFRRSSAEGLSKLFIVIWLLGDVFNILGAVLQGVLPTMLILAVYYTLADLVLWVQCLYYQRLDRARQASKQQQEEEDGNTAREARRRESARDAPDEESPLLSRDRDENAESPTETLNVPALLRRVSSSSVDGTHLSPATPLISGHDAEPPAARNLKPGSALQSVLFNASALVLVCAAGAFGWWLSTWHYSQRGPRNAPQPPSLSSFSFLRAAKLSAMPPAASLGEGSREDLDLDLQLGLELDPLGQTFGYLCAVLYLASRLPQILLNARRRSTDGVSILFFLFACVGNLTYVLSILVYEPPCARLEAESGAALALTGHSGCRDGAWASEYGRYILINLSWLIGSAGTLALDGVIFVQFWMYKDNQPLTVAGRGQ